MLKKQLFFVAGTCFYATLPFYLSFIVILSLLVAKLRQYALVFIAALVCCFVTQTLLFPKSISSDALNKPVKIQAYVEKVINQSAHSVSAVVVIHSLNKQSFYSRVLLTDYQKHSLIKDNLMFEAIVKLKPFANFYNDGARDTQKQMRFKRLYAKGYIKQVVKQLGFKNDGLIKQLRQSCLTQINSLSLSKDSQGLLESLTLGVRKNLSDDWWQVFRATGTGHLIAISGLHVGLFAYAAYHVFLFLWRLSTSLCLRLPAQRAAAFFAMLAALFYVALTDFSISSLRAFLMIALVMLASMTYRKPYLWDVFFTALAAILVTNPYSLYNYGFYLSFYAVFIIFSFMGERSLKLWRLQCIISILMLPISLYFFSYASIASIPANIIAIPMVSFGILPLAILGLLASFGILPLKTQLLWMFAHLSQSLFYYLTWLGGLPFLTVPIVVSTLTQFLSLTSFLWFWLKTRRHVLSAFLGVILLPFCFYSPKLSAGQLHVATLDIGHGLNIVLRTKKHTLIYDTGMRYPSGFSLASIVTLPYLHAHGISKIDKVIISHADNDHRGGLQTLLDNYSITDVVTNDRKSPNGCHQHASWSWDGIEFSFIRLPKMDNTDNNNSCVLKVSIADKSILLTGDIEKKAERYLVNYKKHQLRADILLVPHHGSNTSSTKAFIEAVSPTYAVISAGRMSRFSFPHDAVVKRYQAAAIKTYNTAENGQISWLIDVNKPLAQPDTYR